LSPEVGLWLVKRTLTRNARHAEFNPCAQEVPFQEIQPNLRNVSAILDPRHAAMIRTRG
jgi:hypothetical protein